MAKQTINVGTTANDGTGDTLRAASIKINTNFTELYNQDEVIDSRISSSYNKSNAANTLASAAFDFANTIISDTQIDPYARETANAGFLQANSANVLAQVSFNTANSANTLASAAFDFANTIISDTQIDPYARVTVNASFLVANTGVTLAQNAYNQANTGTTLAQNAYNQANAAFDKANTSPTSLSNSSYSFGMTDNGFINFKYNNNTSLYMSTTGMTSYGQMVLESANNVSGNNSAILFDRNGSGIVFRLEDATPVSLNWGFYQTNILFPDGTRQYTAANDNLAQSAFNKANTSNTLAQSAFDEANTRLQFVSVPSTSKGQTGDLTNDIAANATYLYYCTTDYTDGVADIWKRVSWSADTW